MASTPLSSLKATISTASPTTSSVKSSEHSSNSATQIQQEAHQRGPSLDDDNDSDGDEWGVEIGNLIIDLDADVEKDEMKEKNGVRNSNNNNSIKGSHNTVNPTHSQSPALSNESIVNPGAKLESDSKGGKFGSSTTASGSNPSQQSASKIKSKSKKSIKSATMNKHTSALAQNMASSPSPTTGRNDFPLGNDKPIPSASGGRTAKPEVALSKSNRSYKKHGKNNGNDKKNDAASAKERREKPTKGGIKTSKHQNQGSLPSTSLAYSVGNATFTAPSVVGSSPAGTNKSKRGNSPCFSKTVSNVTNHRFTTPIDAATGMSMAVTNANDEALYDKTLTSHANEPAVLGAVVRLGKHRKTSSLPAPMKYPKQFGVHNLTSASQAMNNVSSTPAGSGICIMEPSADQNIAGKRERISSNATVLSAGSKKIKLEKEEKLYSSGMTPNDGNGIEKLNARSPANLSLRGHLVNVNSEYKMTVGQEQPSSDAKGDKKSNSAKEAASSMSSNVQQASKGTTVGTEPGGQGSTNFPQNNQNELTKRSIGTVTSYDDVGVSTEPESLGPCEPGTSVHLSGIVWHETESGVLVVNVTWRNRSYVGTLLDATKHDWAPPRIPDVDSDTEYRVKSGRPKRLRGANGSGSDGGRKGRKSAMMNNLDEYKCSPSSNKRRNAKMSESEPFSGNDGEICATPSKSAKRARMSRTAAAKTAAQKTVVKESSGDGTSGSGSSTCSSPIFMECPYANCKKRYKHDSALKYHESHAHQGEELAEVGKSGQEEESPAANSPKDSDNGSTKSVEEMPLSDSSRSPTVVENDQTPKESNNNNYQAPMETDSQTPSAQAPFVVTQPQAAPTGQYTTGTYTTPDPMPMQSSFTKSVRNNDEVRTTFDRPTKSSTEIVNSAPTTRPEETAPVGGAVSPYTLTDSQSNDSISLKTRVQTKPSPKSYHSSSRTTTSRPLTTDYNEDAAAAAAALEESSAVENESAQAVQTLLQLQENSQDQLPGLTPYGQTSQGSARSSQLDTMTTHASSIAPSQSHSSYLSPVDKMVTGTHSKPQTATHSLTAPFRSQSKDGTPLPRMSVGVCSPRSQVGSQYVVGGYSHGTVTSNSSQEKAAHTSTGLKTVKGITVPIPTGTQEVLTPSSQSSGINPAPGPAGNAKKQKRKKPKADTGKSPSEPSPKPAVVNQSTARPPPKDEGPKAGYTIPDHTRMKQEHQHQIQSAEKHPGLHHRMQYESQLHGAKHPVVKAEPGMKLSIVPQLPRGQGNVHRKPPHPLRQKIYPQQDQASRGQGTPQTAPGNRNNNNKLNSRGASIQPQQRQANSPIFPEGQDKRDLQMSRDDRPRLVHPSQASHSLPGSRSLTPVDSSAQPRYRLHVPHANDSMTPTNPASAQGPSSSKESSTPPPPLDTRRLSSEGNGDVKRSPSSEQRPSFSQQAVAPFYGPGLYNPYVVPYDLAYHPRLMNGPKFQQHFERVIQNEIQKDQKPKEEPSEGPHPGSSSRPRFTPSPNQQKFPRSKSPSRTENRIAREPSPRVQPYTSQHHQQLPPNGRQTLVHAPRESPVPHSSCPPSANKLSTGAPVPASRGLSPRPQATPPPMSSSRPTRPSSGTERYSRREPNTRERPQIASRTLGTSNRKPAMEEGYAEHRPRSPDKSKLGPPQTTVYPSPGLPVQITPGGRTPVQYYTAPYQHALIDPRVSPYTFPAYAMFSTAPHMFPGHWPPSAPPPTVPGPQEKAPSQSPHSMKSSPYRDDSERRQRIEVRGRDSDSKERIDGPTQQSVKSVTPDPKAASSRNQSGDGNSGTVTPPMQRHLHTHHHIHEGFPPLIPAHPQYPYPMASAVMSGSEAAAAAKLAQYPKRDMP